MRVESIRMNAIVIAVSMSFYTSLVVGDMFLHNPRGSNNRLNGNAKGRGNANRMFDSQNNGDGGYNVGEVTSAKSSNEKGKFKMAYFQSGNTHKILQEGKGQSRFTVEWTNQHGCSDKDLNCNIVLQYMCQPDTETLTANSIRNGLQVTTPVYTRAFYSYRTYKNTALKTASYYIYRGVNEPWEWYDKCTKRNRNQGLFTADQKLKGSTSIFTRQNAAGTRSGYECPEERDYYPYWHPTDWIDVAVFTDNTTFCDDYKKKSFNVEAKGECLEFYKVANNGFRHDSIYNNKVDCEKNQGIWVAFSNYLELSPQHTTESACKSASTTANRLIWALPYRSKDIDNLKQTKDIKSLYRCLVALDPPDCTKSPYTRSNHLGNIDTMTPARYTWVLPHYPSGKAQRCIFRIRYNISTNDYDPLDTFSDQNENKNAAVQSPVTNNPTVQISSAQLPLQLAINTAQFGRTFQDRSHVFKLLPRPKSVQENDIIHNINVRGKRGNLGQVAPAVEYDFIPKRLHIYNTDLVHFQWTGSNTNPSGNAGQGTAGTDRNNIAEMKGPSLSYPITSEKKTTMFPNADIVWSSDPGTKTVQDLIISMASSGYYSGMALCQASPKKTALNVQLNNASPSYRGMLLRFKAGTYYYMCTRNNSFSNRSQKGRLVVGTKSKASRKRFIKWRKAMV